MTTVTDIIVFVILTALIGFGQGQCPDVTISPKQPFQPPACEYPSGVGTGTLPGKCTHSYPTERPSDRDATINLTNGRCTVGNVPCATPPVKDAACAVGSTATPIVRGTQMDGAVGQCSSEGVCKLREKTCDPPARAGDVCVVNVTAYECVRFDEFNYVDCMARSSDWQKCVARTYTDPQPGDPLICDISGKLCDKLDPIGTSCVHNGFLGACLEGCMNRQTNSLSPTCPAPANGSLFSRAEAVSLCPPNLPEAARQFCVDRIDECASGTDGFKVDCVFQRAGVERGRFCVRHDVPCVNENAFCLTMNKPGLCQFADNQKTLSCLTMPRNYTFIAQTPKPIAEAAGAAGAAEVSIVVVGLLMMSISMMFSN